MEVKQQNVKIAMPKLSCHVSKLKIMQSPSFSCGGPAHGRSESCPAS